MDENRGGTPAETPRGGDELDEMGELDELWDQFELALGRYLTTMVDPDEGDHLRLELPDLNPKGDDGCLPYVQFASYGGGGSIRAEVSGDAFLAPGHRLGPEGHEFLTDIGWAGNDVDGDLDDRNWHLEMEVEHGDVIANHVVWVLRTHFGVTHPQLLTYDVWGPASAGVASLRLCATEEVPVEGPASVPQVLAHPSSGRDELVELVRDALRAKYDEEPVQDEDGDFVLLQRATPVWVRVRTDQPTVEIMARVAVGVRSRRGASVELGLLNRDSLWARWTLRERDVWQTIVFPGLPFAPAHLDALLDLYFGVLAASRDDLVLRTGARTH